MRITFQSEGGIAYFPGLSKPVIVDTASLSPRDAAELEGLVQSAQFFTRPEHVGQSAGRKADHRTYSISVEDAGRSHTVEVIEPVDDPALQALIDGLRARGRGPG